MSAEVYSAAQALNLILAGVDERNSTTEILAAGGASIQYLTEASAT